MITERLGEIYQMLLEHFGPQSWWPAQSRFEVIVGAVLTQNTSWTNVEKAIANLKSADLLSPEKLHNLDTAELAPIIKPAGYFNVKAKRLKNLINWLFENYDGRLANLENLSTDRLREELLTVNGVGLETADSILLYAFERPFFVVDTYTARMAVRHELIEPGADYEQLRELFQSNLPPDAKMFNEYHGLLVSLGKEFCKPKPKCDDCPLNKLPHTLDFF